MNITMKNKKIIKEGSIIETTQNIYYLVSRNMENKILLTNLQAYTTLTYESLEDIKKLRNIANIYNNSDLHLG